jgi:hypothetical protein
MGADMESAAVIEHMESPHGRFPIEAILSQWGISLGYIQPENGTFSLELSVMVYFSSTQRATPVKKYSQSVGFHGMPIGECCYF